MLVACRLAGLSALEAHYAGVIALMQSDRPSSCLQTALDLMHEAGVEKQHIGR
jgi:hypothetical protein